MSPSKQRKSSAKKGPGKKGPGKKGAGQQRSAGVSATPPRRLGWPALVAANLLVFGVFGYVAWIEGNDPDLYRMSVQEDEYLEWATFWAFMAAAVVFGLAAWRRRSEGWRSIWFVAGVSLFCFVVAMEEISWLQRVFDYRPAAYFLEHNFQQEPNFHNVVSTDLRKLSLKLVIGGYGVVLPIVALIPGIAGPLRKLGIEAPPVGLVPSFALAYWLYEAYPWQYSGEVVELLLGFGFLFASLAAPPVRPPSSRRLAAAFAAGWVVSMVLGVATAAAARIQSSARLENVDAAEIELEALKADVLRISDPERRRFATRCGVHKRVYSWVEKYDQTTLWEGSFAGLQRQGLAEERARFFIDPWNAPYWIRDRCTRDRSQRAIFVYSFGPNRRRDSSEWEVLGDDVGAIIYTEGR